MLKLKDKERTAILNALKAGVVPPIGLRHMQVGRALELSEIVRDLDHISSEGSTVKFIVGDFGAGKSFFLTLTKLMAHEKRMVVLNADVTTDKILCGSEGKSRSLFTDLMKSMSTRSRPEGNALKSVIETWITTITSKESAIDENAFYKALGPISHFALSQDFAKVLFQYFCAFKGNDAVLTEKCIKWMRAEYETKTEAKKDLGVSRIIEDSDFYDALKLFAGFCNLAGFAGTLIAIDELAVLIRQQDRIRKKNYEALLTILNDCLQGNVKNTGFIFGATGESVENKERGLHSYGALETRLAENKFAKGDLKDFSGPVMRLAPLTKEELFVLLTRLRDIHANFEEDKRVLPDEGVKAFFTHIFSRMGAESHLTPRDVIKEYLQLIAVIESNPGKSWSDFLQSGATESAPKTADSLVKLKVT